jgi:hypothetical protein
MSLSQRNTLSPANGPTHEVRHRFDNNRESQWGLGVTGQGLVSGKEGWATIAGLVTVECLLVGDEVRLFINKVHSSRC